MTPTEIREMIPAEVIQEIEASVKRYKENKYAYQVGLKDLDFDADLLQRICTTHNDSPSG